MALPLKDFRYRKKMWGDFTRDTWTIVNSDVDPRKLHALGVISYRWNICEQLLLGLFVDILDCPNKGEAHVLAHELGALALITRIKFLASTRFNADQALVAAIANALEAYEACRQNRNQLTHFSISLQLGKEGGFHLARRSRKPEPPVTMPFSEDVKDLRRVAKEIRRLNLNFKAISRYVKRKRDPEETTQPLPKILSVPELLWKPPPQAPKERKRQPKSFPESRRRKKPGPD